jgi:hypothetical protein
VIHCYGAASTSLRRRFGWIKATTASAPRGTNAPSVPVIEGEECEFVRVRRRNWARLIRRVWLADPELCPRCGKRMQVVAAISHPAQDDVIEKILRSLNLWDPPWLGTHRARAPPARSLSLSSSANEIAPEPGWQEGVDPPHPENYPDPPSPDDWD